MNSQAWPWHDTDFRPRDWRHRAALRRSAPSADGPTGCDADRNDRLISAATRFYAGLRRARSPAERRQCAARMPLVAAARDLWSAQRDLRKIVELRLLAGAHPLLVGLTSAIDPRAVVLFHELYFDVTAHLHQVDFMLGHLLRPTQFVMDATARRRWDLRLLAWVGGEQVVENLISPVPRGDSAPGERSRISRELFADATEAVHRRELARTAPVNSLDAAGDFEVVLADPSAGSQRSSNFRRSAAFRLGARPLDPLQCDELDPECDARERAAAIEEELLGPLREFALTRRDPVIRTMALRQLMHTTHAKFFRPDRESIVSRRWIMNPDTNPQTEPPAATGAADPAGQRRQVIAAYRSAGLQMADPLAANLAVISCDLMEVVARTVTPVTELLTRASEDGASLSDCERWANLHLRFVKQIDRLAAISQKLERSEH